jgi:predicted lipoprotein
MTLRSSLLSPILGLVFTSVVGACVPTSAPPPPGEEQRRAVLVRLADAVILPRLASLETDAQNLVDATVALEAARGADAVSRADAKSTLVKVLAQWQGLEVVQFGPAGAPTTFTGGLGLRDGIHSWPQVSVCSADQQVVQDRFAEPDWAATRLVNVLGLHTLEYLLFREDPQNACPAAASINAEGTWAALGDAEVVARRATYARVLAADVLVKVQALREAWTGGFADQLKTAGVSGSPFPTAQQALDEVYAALFFVELKVKDRKLAVPAGLHIDCAADVCPELTESPFAHLSVQHIRDNLIGTRAAFVGTDIDGVDGPGFDDLLDDAGHTSAAVDMIGKLDAAITAAAGFTGTLEEALLTEPARVRDLHAVVKAFTDELKGTLPSLLGLRVPDEGAGDND